MIMQRQTSIGFTNSLDTLKEKRCSLPSRVVCACDLRSARAAPNFQVSGGYSSSIQRGPNIPWHRTLHAHLCRHQQRYFGWHPKQTACVCDTLAILWNMLFFSLLQEWVWIIYILCTAERECGKQHYVQLTCMPISPLAAREVSSYSL